MFISVLIYRGNWSSEMKKLNRNDKAKQKDAALFSDSNYEGMHEVSLEERREIIDSIEEVLAREREDYGDSSMNSDDIPDPMESAASGNQWLGAQKRSASLPIWMNLGAFLILGASAFVIWRFLGAERGLGTLNSAGIVSTEGLIVERLREETQAELDVKNEELEELRGQLEAVESERHVVEEEIRQRLTIREEELRADFRDVLEVERRRLVTAGISGDQLKSYMVDYEAAAREEMEIRLSESRARLEDEYENRIAELDVRHGLYEVQISNYDVELERLTAELTKLESEIQSIARSESSEALRTLEELQAHRENEDGIRAQIAVYYERMSDNWRKGNSAAAIELLTSLDSYLSEPGIRQSEAASTNRSVNSFLITTLRRLVNLEETVNDFGTGLREEPAFGPEDLELARNEALAEAAEESKILEERLSAFLLALNSLRNDYAAAHTAVFENNRENSARIASLLSDKLRIKSDLEPSAHALLNTFVESANALEVNGAREQIYGDFLEAIDELMLEFEQ